MHAGERARDMHKGDGMSARTRESAHYMHKGEGMHACMGERARGVQRVKARMHAYGRGPAASTTVMAFISFSCLP